MCRKRENGVMGKGEEVQQGEEESVCGEIEGEKRVRLGKGEEEQQGEEESVCWEIEGEKRVWMKEGREIRRLR